MQRAYSLERTLMLGNIEGRGREWQRTKRMDGITSSMDISLSKLQELVKDRETWYQWVRKDLDMAERLNNSNAIQETLNTTL